MFVIFLAKCTNVSQTKKSVFGENKLKFDVVKDVYVVPNT